MEQKPTPEQLDRALTCAEQAQQKHGHKGGAIWAIESALAAILQSDQQQAELKAQAESMAGALDSYASGGKPKETQKQGHAAYQAYRQYQEGRKDG